ncbi:hypothetical protein [Arthrobacter sp. KK5.5]|uniref:hypothetical protein n=1 Tax=Arthrobacter sp. KK5.5 TaxID=3373084 RepID=UPI003EE5592E
MNKYDAEKSLQTLLEADRQLTARYQSRAQELATASPKNQKSRLIQPRQQLLPNEFPPNTHPDDWEPDCEDERGTAVQEFHQRDYLTLAPWADNF